MSNFNDTTYAALKLVENALKHAKRIHKNFAATKHEAGNILAEELLEVNVAGMQTLQNLNDNTGELITELAQTAAVCIRAIETLLDDYAQ